jgi:hypothetical protein
MIVFVPRAGHAKTNSVGLGKLFSNAFKQSDERTVP